jgi:SAM-dependent methyltransferase
MFHMNISQQQYFDQSTHRYPESKILTPEKPQQLELTLLLEHLNLSRGATVIDFGCGSGRLTFFMLQRGYNVIGVDISRESLADLHQMYTRFRKPFWGTLNLRTTLPSRKVDGVVGADVLHHVEMGQLLPRLKACVRAGGRVSFSEPNAWHIPWYAHYWVNRIPWSIEKGILACTHRGFLQQFSSAKFCDIHTFGLGLLPQPLTPDKWQEVNALSWGSRWPWKFMAFRLIVSAGT